MNPASDKHDEPTGEYKYWLLLIALVVIAALALLGPFLSGIVDWLGHMLRSFIP